MIDIQLLERELFVLIGLPMRSVSRAIDMLCLKFGKFVEEEMIFKSENGVYGLKKQKVGEYALHIQCFFRFSHQDDIRLTKEDLYRPSEKINLLYANDNKYVFNYDVEGNSMMDEIIENELSNNLDGFVVEKLSVREFGDLKIYFRNGFILDVIIDVSENIECWRFFKHSDDKSHLVITAKGIEEYE